MILEAVGMGRAVADPAHAEIGAAVARRRWWTNLWIILVFALTRILLVLFRISEGSPFDWVVDVFLIGLLLFTLILARRAEKANRRLDGQTSAPPNTQT